MSDDGYMEARDKEWAAWGDELDSGTELVAEWGRRRRSSAGGSSMGHGRRRD